MQSAPGIPVARWPRFQPPRSRSLTIYDRQSLALPLFVLGLAADHHDATFASNDFALFAHRFNRRSDFHNPRLLT